MATIKPNKLNTSVFFTEDGIIFGQGDLAINITSRKVTNDPNNSYENVQLINETDADDIEVLTFGGKDLCV